LFTIGRGNFSDNAHVAAFRGQNLDSPPRIARPFSTLGGDRTGAFRSRMALCAAAIDHTTCSVPAGMAAKAAFGWPVPHKELITATERRGESSVMVRPFQTHWRFSAMRKLIIATAAVALLSSSAFAQSADKAGAAGTSATSGDTMSKGDGMKMSKSKKSKKSKKSSSEGEEAK
jgi:hypothetical protein